MKVRGRLRGLVAAALLVVAAGCGGDSPTSPGNGATVVIDGPATVSVVVGDTLRLSATASEAGAAVTWSVGNPSYASLKDGVVVGLRPGSTLVTATAGDAKDTVAVTVTARPNGYTAQEVDYFAEVALGFEYGSASAVVRRWNQPIRFRVNGDPDEGDLAALERVVAEINGLTSTVDMVQVTESPLVEIHFAPVSAFPGILPSYVPGNIGYFSVWFDAAGNFTRAVVLIANDRDQTTQDHLIREEVTQILGLGKDSLLYPESIFYQNWTLGADYAPIDRALVEMLYRPEVAPGMNEDRVGAVLRRLTRGVVAPGVAVDGWAADDAAGAEGVGPEVGMASGGSR